MSELHRTLNERQREAVRWLHGKINGRIERAYFREKTGLSGAECERLLSLLESEECIRVLPSGETILRNGFIVEPRLEQFLEQMDAPPPRNLWNEIKVAYLAKRWFVKLCIVLVVLAILAGVITNIEVIVNAVHWILRR
jgi:hypothetical protein